MFHVYRFTSKLQLHSGQDWGFGHNLYFYFIPPTLFPQNIHNILSPNFHRDDRNHNCNGIFHLAGWWTHTSELNCTTDTVERLRVTSIQAKWTVNTITVELSTSKLSMGFKQWQSNSLLKRRIKSCWLQESLNSDKNLQFWIAGIIVWITDFYSQYQVSCPQERWPWHMAKASRHLKEKVHQAP